VIVVLIVLHNEGGHDGAVGHVIGRRSAERVFLSRIYHIFLFLIS
jgi:hypothetical protein